MSQDSLDRLLVAKGDLGEADGLLTDNLALRHRLYGAAHPTLAMSLESLGLLRLRQGRPGEARRFFEQSRAMATGLLGADHPLARSSRARLEALETSGGGISPRFPT